MRTIFAKAYLAATLCLTAVAQAATITPKAADELVNGLGVVTHFRYGNTPYYANFADIILPALKYIGFRHIRDELRDPTLSVRGTPLLYFYTQVNAAGIDLTLLADPRVGDAPTTVGWATTYAPMLAGIEGTNESDLAGAIYGGLAFPVGEINWEIDLFAALRANLPTGSIPMLTGSLAFASHWPTKCAHEICPETLPDVINWHWYSGAVPISNAFDTNIALANQAAGTKPQIITETGWHTDNLANSFPGISEAAAGKYTSRLPFEYLNRGIKREFLYELIDEFADDPATNIQRHFGLLRFDGTEKPSASAIRRIIKILSDQPYATNTPSAVDVTITCSGISCGPSLHSSTLAKRNGRLYIAVFFDANSYDTATNTDIPFSPQNVTVSFGLSAPAINVYDVLNSDNPVAMGSGSSITVSVADSAIIIEAIPQQAISASSPVNRYSGD